MLTLRPFFGLDVWAGSEDETMGQKSQGLDNDTTKLIPDKPGGGLESNAIENGACRAHIRYFWDLRMKTVVTEYKKPDDVTSEW